MVPSFTFAFPTVVEFGVGKVSELMKALQKENVDNVMVVTDKQINSLGVVDPIYDILRENAVQYTVYDETLPNARSYQVDECAALCVENGCRLIIAVGGGSVMDAAKGAAVVATNGGGIMDYMLMRGADMKIPQKKFLPVIAIPTTSGTGSEVSDCIVVVDTTNKKDLMLTTDLVPRYAYIDPALTFKVPAHITANTGLDVLGHAVEAYVSRKENSFSKLFALEATKIVFAYLPKAVKGDQDARVHMALASMFAGIAQSKCGCILPHTVSNPLAVSYNIPHGLGVGVAQIPTIEFTKYAAADKYKDIMEYVEKRAYDESDAADALIVKIRNLLADVDVGEKLDIGAISEEEIERFVEESIKGGECDRCPRQPVTKEDLRQVFKMMLK